MQVTNSLLGLHLMSKPTFRNYPVRTRSRAYQVLQLLVTGGCVAVRPPEGRLLSARPGFTAFLIALQQAMMPGGCGTVPASPRRLVRFEPRADGAFVIRLDPRLHRLADDSWPLLFEDDLRGDFLQDLFEPSPALAGWDVLLARLDLDPYRNVPTAGPAGHLVAGWMYHIMLDLQPAALRA
ncbi:MAG: hypothetical protein EON55_24125 [Alphaproteobacteria bacterium]|nr:MAG: hypothetical protein EON55_24125 [Alphaproteobacteria bacterium]